MRKTMIFDGIQYDVCVTNPFPNFVEVSFYKVVRPTWKIFRSKFFSTCDGCFFLDEYETIDEGVIHIYVKYKEEERAEQERAEKLKKFAETP